MKLRFYFDYSDYRSYLMMHTLSKLQDLPVQIQWIALDAYSLRALTGCSAHDDCPKQRDFLKQEALRFCRRENIKFVWQNERFHNGSALHVGIWLMIHQNAKFEQYSRAILEMFWGLGKSVDSNSLKNILASIDISLDDLMKSASERENFQIQDNCLQQAMADGVFDIPAVVIEDQLVCHFDQEREIRRLIMLECLKTLSADAICAELASILIDMPSDACKSRFNGLFHTNSTQQLSMPSLDHGIGTIQHSLSTPNADRLLPKTSITNDLSCQICEHTDNIQAIVNAAADQTLTIAASDEFEWNSSDSLDIPVTQTDALIAVRVRCQHDPALLLIRIINGKISTKLLVHADFHTENFLGWQIAILSPTSSLDINMARLAAHSGAHLILISGAFSPLPEAFGCLASSWIINIDSHHALLTDASAQHAMLTPGSSCTLNAAFKLSNADSWNPPQPRTLLLCEKSLTFGELSANADIKLASLGLNLFVNTSQQASELSPTRAFEKFRIQSDTILLLPLNHEQIFIPELISHRLLETLNQAPKDAYPIFVSYWSDLEFEMLDSLRPVLAAVTVQFKIPIILVIGNQVTEIWLSTPQGTPWRIEKDDDQYTIDLDELIQTRQIFENLLKSLSISESTFIYRLQQIEIAAKKS